VRALPYQRAVRLARERGNASWKRTSPFAACWNHSSIKPAGFTLGSSTLSDRSFRNTDMMKNIRRSLLFITLVKGKRAMIGRKERREENRVTRRDRGLGVRCSTFSIFPNSPPPNYSISASSFYPSILTFLLCCLYLFCTPRETRSSFLERNGCLAWMPATTTPNA